LRSRIPSLRRGKNAPRGALSPDLILIALVLPQLAKRLNARHRRLHLLSELLVLRHQLFHLLIVNLVQCSLLFSSDPCLLARILLFPLRQSPPSARSPHIFGNSRKKIKLRHKSTRSKFGKNSNKKSALRLYYLGHF